MPSKSNKHRRRKCNNSSSAIVHTSTNTTHRLKYNNSEHTDIYFIFRDDKESISIPANKVALSSGSEVFKTMFFGSLASESEEVEIPDIEPAAFIKLIKFLYSNYRRRKNEVQIDPESVIDTLYAARKYDVPGLEQLCVDYLENNIASDNAFFLLTQARLYDKPNLEQKCVDYLKNNVANDNAFFWLKEARFYGLAELEQKCVDYLKNNVANDNAFLWLKEARFYDLPELEQKCVDYLKKNVANDNAFLWFKEARFYDLPELEQKCVDYLKSNVSSDNAFLWLKKAQLYNLPELTISCLNIIDKNTTDALNANGFTEIDLETLISVLERDTLQVFESKLFEAIVLWSEAECVRKHFLVAPINQRSVLKQALSLIRYSFMTIKEFKKGPTQSGLLDYREVKKFRKEILSNTNSTERLRCSNSHFESHIKFDVELAPILQESGWFLHGFKAKKTIFIVGFIVLNISKNNSNVKLVLWNKNTPECIFNQKKNLSPSPDTLTFLLNKPITLNKDNSDWCYVRVNFEEITDASQIPHWRPILDGVIDQPGQKIKMNINDYFEWCPHTKNNNIISEIIFYE